MPAFSDDFSPHLILRTHSQTQTSFGHGGANKSGVTSKGSGMRDDVPSRDAVGWSLMHASDMETSIAREEEELMYQAEDKAATWQLEQLEMPLIRMNGGYGGARDVSRTQKSCESDEDEPADLYAPLSPPPLQLLRSLEEELIKSSADVASLKERMALYRSELRLPAGTREGGSGEEVGDISSLKEKMNTVLSAGSVKVPAPRGGSWIPGRTRNPVKEVVEGTPGAVVVHKICQRCNQNFQGPKQVINPRFAAHARYCKREREKSDTDTNLSSDQSKIPRLAGDASDSPTATTHFPPPDLPPPDLPPPEDAGGRPDPQKRASNPRPAEDWFREPGKGRGTEGVHRYFLPGDAPANHDSPGVSATLGAAFAQKEGRNEERMADENPVTELPSPGMTAERKGGEGGGGGLFQIMLMDEAEEEEGIHPPPPSGNHIPPNPVGGGEGGGMGVGFLDSGNGDSLGGKEGRQGTHFQIFPPDKRGSQCGTEFGNLLLSPGPPNPQFRTTFSNSTLDNLLEGGRQGSGTIEGSTSQTSGSLKADSPRPQPQSRPNFIRSPSQSPVSAKVRPQSRIGKKSVENAVFKFHSHSPEDSAGGGGSPMGAGEGDEGGKRVGSGEAFGSGTGQYSDVGPQGW